MAYCELSVLHAFGSQLMVPLEVDQFLVVSPLYQALRDCVAQALLEGRTEALQRELQVTLLFLIIRSVDEFPFFCLTDLKRK